MKFVCIPSISQSVQEWAGNALKHNEVKLIARAGITCCFLNGRGFKSVHEIGISLVYVYILLLLEATPLKSIALTILISFVFTVCMHLSLRTAKRRVAIALSTVFNIWDLFLTINLSEERTFPYLLGVSLFSIAILFILYIDGRRRPGMKQSIFKDMALAGFVVLKYGKVEKYELYPYVISGIIVVWSIKDCISEKKIKNVLGETMEDSSVSREEERQKRPVRKASVQASTLKKETTLKKPRAEKKEKTKQKEKVLKEKSRDNVEKKVPRKKKSTEERTQEEIQAIDIAAEIRARPLRTAAREARGK